MCLPSACVTGFAHCSTKADDGCEASTDDDHELRQVRHRVRRAHGALLDDDRRASLLLQLCCAVARPVWQPLRRLPVIGPCKLRARAATTAARSPTSNPARRSQCISGVCSIAPTSCVSGFAHCAGSPDLGCESSFSSPNTCGSCTTKCALADGRSARRPAARPRARRAACHRRPICAARSASICRTTRSTAGAAASTAARCPTSSRAHCQLRQGRVLDPGGVVRGWIRTLHRHRKRRLRDQPQPAGEPAVAAPTRASAPTALCSTTTGVPTCSSSCVSPAPDLCTTKCVDLKSDPLELRNRAGSSAARSRTSTPARRSTV